MGYCDLEKEEPPTAEVSYLDLGKREFLPIKANVISQETRKDRVITSHGFLLVRVVLKGRCRI